MNERTLLRLSRNDVRPVVVTALQRRRLHIETQAALMLHLAVALIAVRFEDRAHFADEVHRCGSGSHGKKQVDWEARQFHMRSQR